MKHLKMLLCILLSLCTVIGLSGCGNGRQNAGSETGPPSISETEESQTSEVMSEAADKPKDAVEGSVAGSNMIIAYFSWANNAEEYNLEDIGVDVLGHASVVVPGDVGRIAEYIEERTGAEMFPIILTEKYSSNYNECLEQAKDQRGQDEIPELTEHIDNLDDYNVIFLGFPNWWYTIPVAIDSFVAEHDLSGKTVIPFVSHGTGGLAGTIRDLTAILPDDCTLLQSYDVYEDDIPSAQDEVNAWLEELGY